MIKPLSISQVIQYRKGLHVERLHTVPHILPYNNGFHSAGAALIAHDLCVQAEIDSAQVVRYMLLHDIAEAYVGDIPANVKVDFPAIKVALDIAESWWETKFIQDMPDLSPKQRDIAKVADLAELGMYCLAERDIGNSNIQFVINNVITYLEKYTHVIGCGIFITHFITGKVNERK